MLDVARDGHTVEGKREAKRRGIDWLVTLLSGSEPQNLEIARRLQAEGGWDGIRQEVHRDVLTPEAPPALPDGAFLFSPRRRTPVGP